jgi:hypothetical protein
MKKTTTVRVAITRIVAERVFLAIKPQDCRVICFLAGMDEDDSEGMGQAFMQKRSVFKDSCERRVRAEQRKIKVVD